MTTIAPRVEDPQRDADDLQREAERVARGGARAAVLGINDGLVSNLALILGVLPLVFAEGAGKLARHSVGTTVAGGMLLSTFLNIVFIPVLYVVVQTLRGGGARRTATADGV